VIKTRIYIFLFLSFIFLSGCRPIATQSPINTNTVSPIPEKSITLETPEIIATQEPTQDIDSWVYVYSGIGGSEVSFLIPTNDGGVIIGIGRESLVRLDSRGNFIWGRRFRNLYASAAYLAEDGTLIIIGSSRIAHLDSWGNMIYWTYYSHLPGSPHIPAPPFHHIDSVHKNENGSMIASGSYGKILRIDKLGQLESLKLPVGPIGYGYLSFAGKSALWHGGWSNDPSDANWVERKGTDGLSWRRKIVAGENVYVAFKPHFLFETHDEGVLFGSIQRDYDLDDKYKLWLVRFDQSGKVIWQYVYDVDPAEVRVHETRNGDFVIAGWGQNNFHDLTGELKGYLWMARLGPQGDVKWSTIYGNGKSFPVIHKIHEGSDGSIFLSGNPATYEGDQIKHHSNLLVMKLGLNGELQGCDLMNPWPLSTPRKATHNIVELFSEPIEILETGFIAEDKTTSLNQQGLAAKLVQGCVSIMPTPIPVPAQEDQSVWVVSGRGIVLGSYNDEKGWIPADAISSLPAPGLTFSMYVPPADYIGETARANENIQGNEDCVQIELTKDFTGITTLGISGQWEIMPRDPFWGIDSNSFYRNEVRDYLTNHGLTDPRVWLTDYIRLDFDLNGTEDVLISAKYHSSQNGNPIDGSVVLLRQVSMNEVVTLQLLPESGIGLETNSEFKVFGLFDLNGDGNLEVVIGGDIEGSPGTWIFDIKPESEINSLEIGCGL
jgi:hypothetical protein